MVTTKYMKVLTTVNIMITVFWDMALCRWVNLMPVGCNPNALQLMSSIKVDAAPEHLYNISQMFYSSHLSDIVMFCHQQMARGHAVA
jgi:hypothetical protein